MASKRSKPQEWVVEMMEPARLTPNPLNPKVHPDNQKAAVSASLDEFGWLAAPIWNKRTGRLVDGHARAEQALVRGDNTIPVRVIDVDEETELRILAAFDRIGELRGYDDNVLSRLLRDIAETGDALPGWTNDDISDLLLKTASRDEDLRGASGEAGPGERAAAEAAGRASQGDGGATDGGPEEAAVGPTPAHVKMVQIFYGPDEHREFETCVNRLAEVWGLKTPSDVVLEALRGACAGDDVENPDR